MFRFGEYHRLSDTIFNPLRTPNRLPGKWDHLSDVDIEWLDKSHVGIYFRASRRRTNSPDAHAIFAIAQEIGQAQFGKAVKILERVIDTAGSGCTKCDFDSDLMSPAVIRQPDNSFIMWTVNGAGIFGNQIGRKSYSVKWTAPSWDGPFVAIDSGKMFGPEEWQAHPALPDSIDGWHINVVPVVDSLLICLVTDRTNLWLIHSLDYGMTWLLTWDKPLVSPMRHVSRFRSQIYRAAGYVEESLDGYRMALYISGRELSAWGMARAYLYFDVE